MKRMAILTGGEGDIEKPWEEGNDLRKIFSIYEHVSFLESCI